MHKSILPVRLVGLAGSLRAQSFSRATLVGLRNNLPDKVSLDILNLSLPLYNEDEDGAAAPTQVSQFREAIGSSDGLVIVTPEYNHGIPGVLKNALDWASRPYGKSCLVSKPALVISISPLSPAGFGLMHRSTRRCTRYRLRSLEGRRSSSAASRLKLETIVSSMRQA